MTIEAKFKKIVYNFLAFKYVFNSEREYKSQISFWTKLWCLSKGFSSEKYELYKFYDSDYKLFLSDFQRRKSALINDQHSIILTDKNVFSDLFKKDNITANVYGTIIKGQIFLDDEQISLAGFMNFIRQKVKVIIKIHNGAGGKNVYKLECSNDNYLINDQIISKEELNNFISGLNNYMVCEYLEQAEYSSKIYPGTVNTIRILTMIDPETNEVIMPIAVHRFGSEKTKPADNVWKGGMTALVDIETGILQKAALHSENNKEIRWETLHPDTKVKIEGTVIPNWNEVKNKMVKIAKSVGYMKYVGWDVVVTNSGIKIIEGNHCSDVNILQIHQPLLKDERAKEFYRYYKVIK